MEDLRRSCTVIFNFRSDVEREKQDRILEKISSWNGVIKATRLKSDAKDPRLSRMSQVYLENFCGRRRDR